MVERFDEIEKRFKRLEIQFEQLRIDVNTFAEAWAARLEAALLTIEENQRDANDRFLTHDEVLSNHGRRIAVLDRLASE